MLAEPYGDSALLVTAAGGGADDRWRTVQHLADLVEAQAPPGVLDVVATYDTLLVEFDCAVTGHADVEAAIARWHGVPPPRAGTTRLFTVPTCYGGGFGPDLARVAARLGVTEDEVVRLHTGVDWVVRFRGAPVGAPMMDGAPYTTSISRLAHPRPRVPAGSVALSGRQAVIYPVPSAGGWNLIGRTPARLVDLGERPHVAYRPGDRIRFVAVRWSDWAAHEGAALRARRG
ncbi:MAG: allophanate hydrolase subunit 1 [Saccharothrix sp.]|nr:allophanate hydrolase subunit 1 [Saccharothrix sp.]